MHIVGVCSPAFSYTHARKKKIILALVVPLFATLFKSSKEILALAAFNCKKHLVMY